MQLFDFSMAMPSWSTTDKVAVVAACVFLWCLWKLYVVPQLTKKPGRQIYEAVTNHLTNGYSQARPQDIPGADPGTQLLRFWRRSNDTVVIARVDWNSLVEKRYVVMANGAIERELKPATRDIRPESRDQWWRWRTLTLRRCRYLLGAMTNSYLPACARDKDDFRQYDTTHVR